LDSSALGIAQLVAQKRASAFSDVISGDALFPNDFGEDLSYVLSISVANAGVVHTWRRAEQTDDRNSVNKLYDVTGHCN